MIPTSKPQSLQTHTRQVFMTLGGRPSGPATGTCPCRAWRKRLGSLLEVPNQRLALQFRANPPTKQKTQKHPTKHHVEPTQTHKPLGPSQAAVGDEHRAAQGPRIQAAILGVRVAGAHLRQDLHLGLGPHHVPGHPPGHGGVDPPAGVACGSFPLKLRWPWVKNHFTPSEHHNPH